MYFINNSTSTRKHSSQKFGRRAAASAIDGFLAGRALTCSCKEPPPKSASARIAAVAIGDGPSGEDPSSMRRELVSKPELSRRMRRAKPAVHETIGSGRIADAPVPTEDGREEFD